MKNYQSSDVWECKTNVESFLYLIIIFTMSTAMFTEKGCVDDGHVTPIIYVLIYAMKSSFEANM